MTFSPPDIAVHQVVISFGQDDFEVPLRAMLDTLDGWYVTIQDGDDDPGIEGFIHAASTDDDTLTIIGDQDDPRLDTIPWQAVHYLHIV